LNTSAAGAASGNGKRERPVYLVFGASGGIGSALVRELTHGSAGSGARVVLAAKEEGPLQRTAAEAAGKQQHEQKQQHAADEAVMTCDALDPQQVESAVSTVLSRYGRLDGVASCVGNVVAKSASATSLDEFRKTLDTNLVTAFNITQAAIKAMLNQPDGGAVVLVSAAVAEVGIPHFEAMAAAKAGVEGLTRAAAATYAPRGIRINCVAPGLTTTAQSTGFTEKSDAVRDASRDMVPLKRFASPADVAMPMAFLLSPAANLINGQVLAVDGGLSTLHAAK
ncbi:Peroxisomal trans-2-enoyl-CoA reductase, partial [Tetrabaena socialis]